VANRSVANIKILRPGYSFESVRKVVDVQQPHALPLNPLLSVKLISCFRSLHFGRLLQVHCIKSLLSVDLSCPSDDSGPSDAIAVNFLYSERTLSCVRGRIRKCGDRR
jgi:hypothetical protein